MRVIKDKRLKKRSTQSKIDLKIDGGTYIIYNISPSGFGFYIEDPTLFKVGDILSPVTITFNKKQESVVGKIVHVTSLTKVEPKEKDLWVVGLKFLFSEDDRDYYIKEFTSLMENI